MCHTASSKLPSNANTNTTKANSSRFDQALLGSDLQHKINLKNVSHVSIPETSEVYRLLTTYIFENCSILENRISGDVVKDSKDITPETSFIAELEHTIKQSKGADRRLGFGAFVFEHKGHTLRCLHRRVGALSDPNTTNCGPIISTRLIIFVEGEDDYCKDVIEGLINDLLEGESTRQSKTYNVFRWMTDYSYWKKEVTALSRPLDSVVLNSGVKAAVVKDMDEFLDDEAMDFYLKYGTPYKRSYLFHGTTGSGKTSFIQALASKYNRNVCYLQPSDPSMTDDLLREAIKQSPRRSIIVLEDVDALITENRERKHNSHLTYSGILSALDGVGCSPLGQIFILTTNHRDRLDPALTRNGRVDLHVRFTPATIQMMSSMFLKFYPGAEALSSVFGRNVRDALGDTPVSMAAMQHFFICNRRSTAEEALGNVKQIPANLKSQTDVCGDDNGVDEAVGAISSGGNADQSPRIAIARIDVQTNVDECKDEESCDDDKESCDDDEVSCNENAVGAISSKGSIEQIPRNSITHIYVQTNVDERGDEDSCDNDEDSCDNDEGSCDNDEDSCDNGEGSCGGDAISVLSSGGNAEPITTNAITHIDVETNVDEDNCDDDSEKSTKSLRSLYHDRSLRSTSLFTFSTSMLYDTLRTSSGAAANSKDSKKKQQ